MAGIDGAAGNEAARIRQMIESDRFIKLFGIEVEEASADFTRVSAVVKEEFLNGHLVAHGGFIFSLADVAFALTVNAQTDAVAVQWSLSQFRSGARDDRVTAECRLLHSGRRLRVVELLVSNSEGKMIAKGQATAIPVDIQQLRK
ncbi:MAG: hotdog fold thioesterase [Actinobacteria bacterium]|nr:hotdog fold thioesterase [Actinomycetota bacterium]